MAIETEIGTSLTTIATVPAKFAGLLSFQIENLTGGANFNAFSIQARNNAGADNWIVLQSTDPTSSPAFGIRATVNLVTLATGSRALLTIPGGFHEIRLRASVASGTTDVVVYPLAAQ